MMNNNFLNLAKFLKVYTIIKECNEIMIKVLEKKSYYIAYNDFKVLISNFNFLRLWFNEDYNRNIFYQRNNINGDDLLLFYDSFINSIEHTSNIFGFKRYNVTMNPEKIRSFINDRRFNEIDKKGDFLSIERKL